MRRPHSPSLPLPLPLHVAIDPAPPLLRSVPSPPALGVPQAMGLHAGWAIEGVAGSIFKADATFLSAAAELPGRVVDAAAPLGVPIVLTGDFCVRLRPAPPFVTTPSARLSPLSHASSVLCN